MAPSIDEVQSMAVSNGTIVPVDLNLTSKATISGMECATKDLYQGPENNRGQYTWTDVYPDDLGEPAENAATAKFAILVRHKKVFNDSRKALEIDSIVIQSPLLKKALGVVLADYPGVTTSLARLTFQAPFRPFVHRWEGFTNAIVKQEDGATKKHLELLYRILKEELNETIDAKDDFIKNKVITYEHLWTIFQPGCVVHSTEYGRDCGLKFNQGSYVNHPQYGPCFQLSCQKVDFDGEKFGFANETSLIGGFVGTMKITELEAFPLEFHPKRQAITDKLIARGKLFEQLQGYHFKMYKGTAIAQTPCGPVKVQVESRLIVDRYNYGKNNPNAHRTLYPLKNGVANPKAFVSGSDQDCDEDDDGNYAEDEENVYSDSEYYDEYDHDGQPKGTPSAMKDKKLPRLTKDELVLCTPLIKGYALKTKKWLEFFVDSVTDINFNGNAFESLVLPADQKELILSFAESQILYKQKFDDFVSGKGKGIIMLLSGTPGVGKTLTAESVAEHMKVPLYMLSASDLGTNSVSVESSLTNILEMVAKWNAVLLLDECDVFLEARNANDLERNKLVSIFLRMLEYYEGILFMTTNRVDNMDAAFQSRIHISMEYPPLTSESRKKVWENFLGSGMEHDISDVELTRLAEIELNGRQIKNVLKTSQLLACRKNTKLGYSHVKTVLSIEQRSLGLAVGL